MRSWVRGAPRGRGIEMTILEFIDDHPVWALCFVYMLAELVKFLAKLLLEKKRDV